MSNWNFADVWETVATVQPEAPALIRGNRSIPWSEFDHRADALAAHLLAGGLGHQAKVALLLHNSTEYLETLFACFKASLVPVNTNYRYVADEITALWEDADVEAVVFHSAFTPVVETIRASTTAIREWIVVPDGASGRLDWAVSFDEVAESSMTGPVVGASGRSGDDLFLLYTGGTTGRPKGVMWRQDDLFAALNRSSRPRYPEHGSVADVASALATTVERGRVIPAAPLMHGTAAFSSFAMLDGGGTVVLTEGTGFDPEALLATIATHRATDVAIVGDAFARPMLAALDAHPDRWDLSSLTVMISSGVMWSAPVKEALIAHVPGLLCVDTLGSSEAVGMARSVSSDRGTSATAGFSPGPDTRVIHDDGRTIEPGDAAIGRVAIRGRTPIGYYKDPERSARTFPVIDGERWSVPGDFARIEADGRIVLLGRGSGCINTGGEKVFPEEVEEVLKLHDDVRDAVVVGVPDERFGQKVVAIVESDADLSARIDELQGHVRSRLAGYKTPREWMFVPSLHRAVNGKIDHRHWTAEATRAFNRE